MPEPKVSLIIAAKDLASRVFDQSKAKVQSWGQSVSGVLSGVKGLLAGLGVAFSAAAIVNVFRRATAEAIESESANNRMSQSIANLGLSYDALKPKIDDTVDRLSRLAGKDDEEVSDALSNLITKTGDLTGSLANLPLVLDIAAQKKISLGAASDLVGKAMNGQTRALKELGITTKDHDKAMQQLRDRYAGFAAKEGQSVQGMIARIRLGWANMLETLGEVILGNEGVRGALADVEERLQAGRAWIQTHREEIGRWVGALATLATWLIDAIAFLVRITGQTLAWLDAHRGLTRFMAASVGTFTAAFVPLTLAGAVTIPTLLAALSKLRIALLAAVTNPILLGLAAVSAAIGFIALESARAQQKIQELRDALAGLSSEQLGVRETAARARLVKLEADAAASRPQGLEDKMAGARASQLDKQIADAKRELAEIEAERTRRVARAMTEFAVTETQKRTPAIPGKPGGGTDGAADAQKAERERLELLKLQAAEEGTRAKALATLAALEASYTHLLEQKNLTTTEELRLRKLLAEVQGTQAAAFKAELDRLKERAGVDSMRIQALSELARLEGELTAKLHAGSLTSAEELRLRRELGEVREAQAAAQKQELESLQLAVDKRRITVDVITRLYTVELQLVEAMKAEDAAIKAGHGSLVQYVALQERLASAREILGKPPKVGEGTGATGADATRPARRITVNRRDKEQLDEAKTTAPEGFRADVARGLEEFSDRVLDPIGDGTERIESLGDALAAVTSGSLSSFQDAWLQSFEMIGAGTVSVGEGLANMGRTALTNIARGLAQLYFAKGTAMLGEGLFGHPTAFASAAKFFAASALFAAISGAVGGGQTGGSRGGGGGGRDDRAGDLRGFRSDGGRSDVPVTVVMPSGTHVFDSSNPRIVEAWARMLEDLTGRRVVVKIGG